MDFAQAKMFEVGENRLVEGGEEWGKVGRVHEILSEYTAHQLRVSDDVAAWTIEKWTL